MYSRLKQTPLSRVSKARRAAQAGQRTAYQEVKEESDGRCVGCGGTWFLTPSHCWSQKQYPQHRDNARNILILCVNCHSTFEHNKPKFRRVCPDAWDETLRRMKEVDAPAYAKFCTLNPTLFT